MQEFNVLVSTVPKCGTYLGAAILRSVGFQDQELHVYNSDAENYRGIAEEEKILKPVNTFKFDLVHHLRWAQPKTFVVGHPGLTQDLKDYLLDENRTKVLYIVRDLRDAAISQMRFLHRAEDIHSYVKQEPFWGIEEVGPEKLFAFLCSRAFSEWLKYAYSQKYWVTAAKYLNNIAAYLYEDLIEGNKLVLDKLALYLETPEIVHSEYYKLATRTYNPNGKSSIEKWGWSKEHDKVWKASGAKELNTLYEDYSESQSYG